MPSCAPVPDCDDVPVVDTLEPSSVAVPTAQVDLYAPIGQPPLLALRFDCDVIS